MSRERIEQIGGSLDACKEIHIRLGVWLSYLIHDLEELHKDRNLTLEPMEAVGFEREILA